MASSGQWKATVLKYTEKNAIINYFQPQNTTSKAEEIARSILINVLNYCCQKSFICGNTQVLKLLLWEKKWHPNEMANPQLIKKDSKGIYPHPNEMAHSRLIKKDSKGIYPIYLKA